MPNHQSAYKCLLMSSNASHGEVSHGDYATFGYGVGNMLC